MLAGILTFVMHQTIVLVVELVDVVRFVEVWVTGESLLLLRMPKLLLLVLVGAM